LLILLFLSVVSTANAASVPTPVAFTTCYGTFFVPKTVDLGVIDSHVTTINATPDVGVLQVTRRVLGKGDQHSKVDLRYDSTLKIDPTLAKETFKGFVKTIFAELSKISPKEGPVLSFRMNGCAVMPAVILTEDDYNFVP
jgi:hypothetical protein